MSLLTDPPLVVPTEPSNAPPLKSSTVDAIVLGGHHWRPSALESVVPRPLLPVAQRPLLFYVLQWLGAAPVGSVIVCTNGVSEARCRELGRQASLSNVVYREDGAQRGPAGCARDALAHTQSDQVLILEGSVIPALDLSRLLNHHARTRAAVTVVVQPAGRRSQASCPVPTGVYVFDRSALQLVQAAGFQDIKETLIPLLYRAGAHIGTYEADGPCPRVLDAATYLGVNQWMIGQIAGHRRQPPFEAVAHHAAGREVVAHPSARIDQRACLIGPVLVGPFATIAADATIIGPASIGTGTSICAGALISRSVLWDRCTVGIGASLDGTIVMHHATVAAGERLVATVRTPAPPVNPWRGRISRAVRRTVVRQFPRLADVSTVQVRS